MNEMNKRMGQLRDIKNHLEAEAGDMKKRYPPGILKEKRSQIENMMEKLQNAKLKQVEVKKQLTDRQEEGHQHQEAKGKQQVVIDEMKNRSLALVSETNNLTLKLEAKQEEGRKMMQNVEEKLKRVEELCESREGELKKQLSVPLEEQKKELEAIIQKNGCLEETYEKRCEEQKKMESQMAELRAAAWEKKEKEKEQLKEEINKTKNTIEEKKKNLEKLRAKAQKEAKRRVAKQDEKRRKCDAQQATSKAEFKKPTAPSTINNSIRRINKTNELFNKLREPLDRSMGALSAETPSAQVSSKDSVTLKENQTQMEADITSILSMSSIEPIEALDLLGDLE